MDTSAQNTAQTTISMFPFDLNQPPTTEDQLSHVDADINVQPCSMVESNTGGNIPDLLVTPSEDGIWVIDFNISPILGHEYPLVEIDTNQLNEDSHPNEEDERRDADNETNDEQHTRRRCKFTHNLVRKQIYEALLMRSVDGNLKRNTTAEVARLLNVHIRTVQRIWKQSKQTSQGMFVDVSHKKTGNCGRKRIQINPTIIREIPCQQRTTLTSLAEAVGVSYSTMFRLLKRGLLRRHSNAIKPHLREGNKISRLKFCLSMLDESSLSGDPKFQSMYNYVHIDEKWFYLTKKEETYYLLPDEEEPLRTCQSKNYIGKVMFLAATTRPRFDNEGNEISSGKIGIFPFVTEQPAQRRTRNRDAGTLEMKAMTSIKRETIKVFLIEKVIPAIKEKWPRSNVGETIFIQQDNARTHVSPSDPDVQATASSDGFDIKLICQPPNSPDLNVLDLGFFRAIQSLQQKKRTSTIEELVLEVHNAFEVYPTHMLNRVFLTLQCCMREIMKLNGGNRYRIPHIKKGQLEKEGCLPIQISCDSMLVETAKELVAAHDL